MEFHILGAMEVVCDGKVTTPSAPKLRWVLALLLIRANRIVDIASLIDEVWGDRPPRSVMTTTQTYIYQLRKMLSHHSAEPSGEELIVTQPPGYMLRISKDQLDANVFERLSNKGRILLQQGSVEEAARCLQEAVELWRGPALADVPVGRILEAHVARLEEMRIRTLELYVEANIRLKRHREMIPELRSLVVAHPLNEWFHKRLIQLLGQTGRRGEALEAYQNLRRTLDQELGLEPSNDVQLVQRGLLAH